jgi:hypothetical protein
MIDIQGVSLLSNRISPWLLLLGNSLPGTVLPFFLILGLLFFTACRAKAAKLKPENQVDEAPQRHSKANPTVYIEEVVEESLIN